MLGAPLEDKRVIELGTYVAAPALGSILGALGAEVIKIEPIDGDPTRVSTPWSWASYNWNKKSVCINLKKEEGMKIMERLIASSDIFIESLSPRAIRDLGLSYDRVNAINKSIIYCSIKGFASDSKESQRVGFDSIAQAEAGLMHIARSADGRPARVGNPCVDLSAASFAAISILSSLLSGSRGTFIEISLFDVVLYWNGYWFPYISSFGMEPENPSSSHPGFSPYGIYRAKDGYIFIGCLTDEQWHKLCSILEIDRLRELALKERIRARDIIDSMINRKVGKIRVKEVLAKLGEQVPCAKVNTLMEIYNNKEHERRGIVRYVKHDGNRSKIVLPPILSLTTVELSNTPKKGANTLEILTSLGMKRGEIVRLRRNKIIA